MKFLSSVLLAASLVHLSSAFDCNAKELDKYNVKALKGVYTASNQKDTPPSVTKLDWSIGVCQEIGKVEHCASDDDICGKVTVENDGKSLLSEVFEFKAKAVTKYKLLGDDGEDGFTVEYLDIPWSDTVINANLVFQCVNEKEAEREFTTLWDGKWFSATIKTDKACLNSKDKPSGGDDNGESWGWFTWIFIFMVLFLSIYIIGGAWFQYNKGNAIDFQSALKEVLENFIDLLRGLPAFVREILERFTRNNNRGEYSAV